MESFTAKRHGKSGPEAKIQKDLITLLLQKGWYIKVIPGSKYLSGMPDLFATHSLYRQRLIEVKLPGMVGSKFTPAQLDTFPKLSANGSGIWILTAATEMEYKLLFKAQNWWQYLPGFK